MQPKKLNITVFNTFGYVVVWVYSLHHFFWVSGCGGEEQVCSMVLVAGGNGHEHGRGQALWWE